MPKPSIIAYYADLDKDNPNKMREDLDFFARSLPASDIDRFNKFKVQFTSDLREFEADMKWPPSWGSQADCIKQALDIVTKWLTRR
ncbi:MAG: hypothetical protein ACLQKK_14305 [Rhodomicrobium sp.]